MCQWDDWHFLDYENENQDGDADVRCNTCRFVFHQGCLQQEEDVQENWRCPMCLSSDDALQGDVQQAALWRWENMIHSS